jgi:hypothetical protein
MGRHVDESLPFYCGGVGDAGKGLAPQCTGLLLEDERIGMGH